MTEHDNSTVEENENTDVTAEEVTEKVADAGADSDAGTEESPIEKHIDVVLIKKVLEGAILASDSPLNRDAMVLLFDEAERPDKKALDEILVQLAEDYDNRGIELREVSSGFRFQVRKDMGPWVSRLWQEKPARYSRAIMETLALIAYRQPITRGEIEEIRGVAVNTQIVRTLLERGWARVVGHRDVPGRPAMYATTREFLDYFDLKSLEDLPTLSEIRDLDKLNEELQLEEKLAQAGIEDEHDGEQSGDESRQTTIMDAINDEPEIDESTLMSLDKVDEVLAGFEAEFRKKPQAQESEQEQDAEPEHEEETPAPDMLNQDSAGEDQSESDKHE